MPKQWEKEIHHKAYMEHLDRVRSMKATVDNGKPKELPLSIKREIERVSSA